MNDYTPTTDEVRECYVSAEPNLEGYALIGMDPPTEEESRAAFDCWLDQVRAGTEQ